MESIFREEARRRLETTEHLDRVLTVAPAKSWLALAILGLIAAAVLYWSVAGEVARYVEAPGIFLDRGARIVDVGPTHEGALLEIRTSVGAQVEEGELLATVTNDEMSERHNSALNLLGEREVALRRRRAVVANEMRLETKNYERRIHQLEQLEAAAHEMVGRARQRLEEHQRLYADSIITRATLDQTQQAFDQAQRELFEITSQQDALEFRHLRTTNELETSQDEAEHQVEAARREVAEVEAQLGTYRILAPAHGRVTEIKAVPGAALRPGQAILSLESPGDSLDVVVYIPPADGKRVEAGHRVLVSPATTKREESGVILGAIRDVSRFPISFDGLVAVLHNQDLARAFQQEGAPFQARAILDADPSHASGFAWTSPKAAEVELSAGTLASVEIIVESRPPITLVVPLLKEAFGLH